MPEAEKIYFEPEQEMRSLINEQEVIKCIHRIWGGIYTEYFSDVYHYVEMKRWLKKQHKKLFSKLIML